LACVTLTNMSEALTRLAEMRPEVLVVWPETFVPTQFDIWESYFRHSSHRIAVLSRTFEGKTRPDSDIPMFFEDDDHLSLAEVARISSIRVVLYPTVRLRFRKHINAFAGRRNVFVGHGDSDKASSARSRNRIFDSIFVADEAARQRYGHALPDALFVSVGAPFLDGVVADDSVQPIRKVLYAPTWEGHEPDNNYSSVTVVAENLDSLAGPDVRVLMHPGVGSKSQVFAAAAAKILARFPAANRGTKVDEFNDSDAIVTDISGVLTEYLATRKPIVIVDPGTHIFNETFQKSATGEFAVKWDPETIPLAAALEQSQTPGLRKARIAAADRKFQGAESSVAAQARFDVALGAEIAAAERCGLATAVRTVRKLVYKKNPVTALKAVARFVLRRPSRPVH
jgi:hypothetical protein